MKHRAIAICGLIGSGKSQVGRYLVDKGYDVVDCDIIARQVSNDKNILFEVSQLLGEDSIVDGKLNRPYIRSVVFSNSQLLAQYSDIFNHAIRDALVDSIKDMPLVFVQLPVYDAIEYHWYRVWNVVCDEAVRIGRTVSRDKTSTADVEAISNKQKSVNGTDIIDNSGSVEQLHATIDKLLEIL